jgi:hypothetical protein
VFVYGLHWELHDQIRFTDQLPFGSRISDKEVSLKAFFTRIFQIPRLRDCRQILGITTTTWTRTDGYPDVHQRFQTSVQCQRGRSAPMHFLPSFFHSEKPMPFGTRSLGFSNSQMRPSPRQGNVYRIISLHAPITAWRSGSSSKAYIMGWFTQSGSI